MGKSFLNPPKSRIILALDTPDKRSSHRVMEQCADIVDAIKINYPLVLTEGLGFISELKTEYGLPLIADFKVADAPVTNNRIARMAKDAGVDALMVHGFIGADAIMEIQEVAKEEMGIFVVTELTHPGGLEFTRSFSEPFARMAAYLDCFGIQAPGTRPDRIQVLRDTVGPDMTIIACGIGAQGGTLETAVQAGADYGIIGRSIYEADNPRQAAMDLAFSEAFPATEQTGNELLKEVHVVRYCSETDSYTLRAEPADEMRDQVKQFVQYCRSHGIGLELTQSEGVLLKKKRSLIHVYTTGSCLISNLPSAAEGEKIARDFMQEVRTDMDA
ncbi:orotidine-5'-phosphate decarboxylase [Paenibacillus senegalensis]|uniref:orotidine-5'-phosphate decarboxylase n=1 Tax=Paenibacillus senegalensis TaxID=1465766 RepID=UPI00028867F3|nr:orotidine-5'-phosphate decarboxylase [Paenibacillus senegalensis]